MDKENEKLKEYFMMFGDFPFLLTTMTYEDEWYQKKMEEAIKNGKPIVEEDLEEIQDYDVILREPQKGFSNFKKKSDSEPKDPEKE